MGIDDVAFPDDAIELAENLVNKTPTDTRHPGVYIIYDGKTNEPLYVGESKNVFQRLFDHHQRLQSESKTVREYVEDDPDLDRKTERGTMWEWTKWKWIEISGGQSRRKEVERAVELKIDPRYSSN